ncbi:MAG: VCBS repeat-containing protein, partial [Victivallaceae bacterium]
MKDHYPEWCITREYRINFEVEVSQSELSEKFAYIPIQCRELDWKSFLPPGPDKADFNSLAVVRYDIDTGRPFVFDEEAEKEKRFIIPHRFEHEHKPFALPFYSEDRGSLTWLAPFLPARQYYSVYFDLKRKGNDLCGYQGLIGDGDIFTQRKGIMCVHGNSRPVLYGKKLFGKKGLVVASSYKTGIYFFEETGLSGSGPNFVNRGRLKDIDGKVIWGIPTFHDFKGRGILDLVVGRNDGTVYRYNNLGSNDNPIFSRPEPLKEINGSPVDLKKYLRDKNIIVRLTDGAVNPRYPEMPVVQVHGGENHIYTTPEFVDWSNTGRYDLLIGTKGGFLLHFEYTASGYREGRFLKDEKGEMISNEISAFPAVVSRNENGRQDLILGSYHGFLYYLKNIGMDDGVPIFQNKGKIPVEKETGCSFPMFSGNNLFVGNSRGEVKSYTVSGTAENGVPVFTGGKYILINNAWIGHQMPVARYTDMDGDGKKDLLSGDIQGGVFLYRNLGTNRNPVFSKRYWLNAENCPIKIEGGPDPIESDDGYSKPVTTDISGDGKADILVGSGLGRIFFYRNLGPDKEGIPRFAKGVVLKDNQGNEIRCHHMSAVEVADWDGDGIPDIIVSGQKDIHKLKSDDPDRESQVRWYRGLGRDKTGNLLFAPYIPLEAEGDKEFQYRPIPPAVGEWEKKKVLYIGNNIFRQVNKNIPEQVEFLGTLPPRLIHAREGFIGAYSTFSSLGENDPVIVNASCISSIFAFRRSFVLNRGYLKAGFRLTALQKADGSFQKKLNLSIDQPPLRIP